MVVVRDYSKEPRPKIVEALALLGKKHREEFRKGLKQAKEPEQEGGSTPTPVSSWNPLKRIFSVFQNDEVEEKEELSMPKLFVFNCGRSLI